MATNRPALLQVISKQKLGPITNNAPSFLLRGINPTTIWKKYQNGTYSTQSTPDIPITPISCFESKLGSVCSDKYSERYKEHPSLKSHLCVTTNSSEFTQALAKLEGKELTPIVKPRLCRWCRMDLSDLPEDAEPLGTIVKIEIKEENQQTSYVIYTVGHFCRTGCNYAELTSRTSYWNMGDLVQMEEKNLRFLFNELYPGKELVASPHWELHERNGGPLNDEEYYSNQYYYHPTTHIIKFPAKKEYLALKRATKN